MTLEVGSSNCVFQVHLGIVTKQSKVFAAAFKIDAKTRQGFKEAAERSMRLPEEAPDTVKVFVHWLYTGQCPSTANGPADADNNTKLSTSLVDLYVFGDKYDVPRLREDCFNALIGAFGWKSVPGYHVAAHAYKLTPSESPLRKLFAIGLGTRIQESWIDSLKKEQPCLIKRPQLMFDILLVLAERPNRANTCPVRLKALLPEVAPDKTENKSQS